MRATQSTDQTVSHVECRSGCALEDDLVAAGSELAGIDAPILQCSRGSNPLSSTQVTGEERGHIFEHGSSPKQGHLTVLWPVVLFTRTSRVSVLHMAHERAPMITLPGRPTIQLVADSFVKLSHLFWS
jgi:hypothetical protein